MRAATLFSLSITVGGALFGCVAVGPQSYSDPALRRSCETEFSARKLDAIEGFWTFQNEYASGTTVIYKTDLESNNGFSYVGRVLSETRRVRVPHRMPDRRASLRLKSTATANTYIGQAALIQGRDVFYVDCTVQVLDPTTLALTLHSAVPIMGGNTQRAHLTGPHEVLQSRRAAVRKVEDSPSSPSQIFATGFLVAPDLVATCNHVVDHADALIKCVIGGKTLGANVIVRDVNNDLALLRLSQPAPAGIAALPVGRGSEVRQGQRFYSLGYPLTDVLGTDIRVHSGIVSSLTGFRGSAAQMQIEMSINPGNSGGPVISDEGRVVGVLCSKLGIGHLLATGNIPDGIAFASKSDFLWLLAESGGVGDALATPLGSETTFDAEQIAHAFSGAVVRVEATLDEE
jgi:S1-C subfamily serine protease